MKAEDARMVAHKQINKLDYIVHSNSIDTIRTIKFHIPSGQFVDQRTVAGQNLELDQECCLGRVAQVAAIVEKHFPFSTLELAEVWDDQLKCIMLQMLEENSARAFDSSFMQELLMYEEPHAVLVVDNFQFDPLSLELGSDIVHPYVRNFPLWEAIAACATVSEAWLEAEPQKKLNILAEAEAICPGLVIVRENTAGPLELLGKKHKAIEAVRWSLRRRLCARSLYVLYLLTNEKIYYDQLVHTYTEEIIKYF